MLVVLVSTLITSAKYSRLNRDNLTQSIQIQLSKKQKPFCQFYSPSLKCKSNFEHFEQKDDTHSLCIIEITDCKRHGWKHL